MTFKTVFFTIIVTLSLASTEQVSAMQPAQAAQQVFPNVSFNNYPNDTLVDIMINDKKVAVINPALKNVVIKGAAFFAIIRKVNGERIRSFDTDHLLRIQTINITKDDITGEYGVEAVDR